MKTLELKIELKFDDDLMYSDDPESIDWFYNDILLRKSTDELLLLHCNEIGDTIGEVKVLEIKGE